VIDTADAGIIAPKYIMDVVKEYEKPHVQGFTPDNKWSLYNAYTHVMKAFSPQRFDDAMRDLSVFFALGTKGLAMDVAAEPVAVPALT
jgi:hypothetical protein